MTVYTHYLFLYLASKYIFKHIVACLEVLLPMDLTLPPHTTIYSLHWLHEPNLKSTVMATWLCLAYDSLAPGSTPFGSVRA